ncbi:general secretion pathway protein J [Ectothiorhodospira mobilis]|uniref:Type II secretion system protein J n=1 Tax=Ectothiorhodospira mobilis TaxID=195064 RepID=A0A1I4R4P4_ECTMO|nr:type II secretion system minor pseudopilin GspJ [Ectothiorhodospira mobilis]SFM47274.1 general secretion pathway protein J [Ectothiorhodospira mobilis]
MSPIPLSRRHQGFTLLELVVTLALFALVSVMAYGGLRTVLETRQLTDAAAHRLARLQMAVTLLGRDLEQLAQRPVRDAYGDPVPPLRYSALREPPRLELVRAGAPGGEGRSRLRRVAWEREDDSLYRLQWSILDGGGDTPAMRMPVLAPEDDLVLREWSVRFYHRDATGETAALDYWPPAGTDPARAEPPLAVEVILDIEGVGRITRLFPVS